MSVGRAPPPGWSRRAGPRSEGFSSRGTSWPTWRAARRRRRRGGGTLGSAQLFIPRRLAPRRTPDAAAMRRAPPRRRAATLHRGCLFQAPASFGAQFAAVAYLTGLRLGEPTPVERLVRNAGISVKARARQPPCAAPRLQATNHSCCAAGLFRQRRGAAPAAAPRRADSGGAAAAQGALHGRHGRVEKVRPALRHPLPL